MSEQAPETTGRPPGAAGRPGGGKKILGMSRPQAIGLGLVALGGIIYLIYRARKNAQAAAQTASTAGTCPDGSTPDANGNCPQSSQDFSGQIGTLQDEIGQLQSELAGVGAGSVAGSTGTSTTVGGTTGTTGTGSTGGTGGTGGPTPTIYPLNQTGVVTSATTGRQGKVTTTNGGKLWTYSGVKPAAKEPKAQTGTVYSNTTQRTAKVATTNGGQTWIYEGVPSSA